MESIVELLKGFIPNCVDLCEYKLFSNAKDLMDVACNSYKLTD